MPSRVPMLTTPAASLALILAVSGACCAQSAGNRLAYLDGDDPYYVGLEHPKLITPQWVGEGGVEAVVTLAIDDMNAPLPWVPFLKPTIQKLKQLHGRAPLSIMTTRIDPSLEVFQELLADGVSLECHTYDHPCPILQRHDFAAAKATYDRCVELMNRVPGSRPVAFRVPCCDSRNTPSPRFYAEIFNATTASGRYLEIDSSVFNVLTPDDPELPRALVVDDDGREKARKYLPFDSFVNTIENYPYPYVIGRLCWEFPCVTPSDWAAQNLNGPGDPRSFADLTALLDAVVIKRGTYNLVFHPYGWSRATQIVGLVEHAAERYGDKVRFLSFRECLERIDRNLLAGQPLRAADGGDNGVRLLDVNADGYLDVAIGNGAMRKTRVWQPAEGRFVDGDFPIELVQVDDAGARRDAGARFGVVHDDGRALLLCRNEKTAGAWHHDGRGWQRADEFLNGLELDGEPIRTSVGGRDQGVRLRDVDMDGRCELIVGNPQQRAVFAWNPDERRWERLAFDLPALTRIVDARGRDAGLRFVDVDEDGHDDVVFSNEERSSLHLWRSRAEGWSTEVRSGPRTGDDAEDLPMIVRDGTDAGAWFHSRHLWVQNEDTAHLPDLVDRRSFNDLLATVTPTARTPEASLRSIRLHPGFRAELVAAEPLTRDPIAINWGFDGELWVAEMGDYPNGATEGDADAGGRIRRLEDVDGDGRYDRSTVFLDRVAFPTSVMPWRDGILVTCAPEILYAVDTDGDHRADRREVLYTGFVEGNQQHRVNGLRQGLDNWIYCANGDSGGTVRAAGSDQAVDIRGRDFRIRPGEGLLDPQTGMTQFGRFRDDWGNWFGGNSGRPLWHCVLPDHYLRRNPHFAPQRSRVDLLTPPSFAPVFPISRPLERFNDPQTLNRFTSACGAGTYRDELFGPHFESAYFVCEPVHNLVHAGRLTASGATFAGARMPGGERSEFLASSDNWFRPTQVRTGPDGALWVVDMYRAVIEHPRWIPESWQRRLDLRAGHDRGRIYRIVPVDRAPRAIPRLGAMGAAELVAALASPNGVQRDLAQQLLVERRDRSAVAALERLVAQSDPAASRLQALCTLDGLGAASTAVLLRALRDPHPAVRRHALRIGEARLPADAELQDAVLALTADPAPQVRLQLAFTLGGWSDRRAGRALGRIALADAGDPFVVAAAMSSAVPHLAAMIREVAGEESADAPRIRLMRELIVVAVRAGDAVATETGLGAIARAPGGAFAAWQLDALAELLDALGRGGSSLAAVRDAASPRVASAIDALEPLFAAARELAVDPDAALDSRLRAVRLLARGTRADDRDRDRATLAGLLGPSSPNELELAAAEALARLESPDVPRLLLAGWQGHTPGLRNRVLDALLSRTGWTEALLDGIADQTIRPASLAARHRQQLIQHRSAPLRARAATLLASDPDTDRSRVVASHRSVLELTGDPARGARLFGQHCATCHRLSGLGYNVGPDLRALTDRSPEALLTSILDPNRAVDPRHVSYVAITKDGRAFVGTIADETGTGVVLTGALGTRHALLRTELAGLTSTGVSLMPQGLEAALEDQDLADVIAYVAQDHPQRKHFAGNEPVLIEPLADGSLALHASTAELSGNDIHYYTKARVIGDWHAPADRAVWSLDLPRSGEYDVYLEWACAKPTAGNRFLVEVNGGRLTGTASATGDGWGKYERHGVGRLKLNAGLQSLVVRSDGPIEVEALFDLRAVELIPVGK